MGDYWCDTILYTKEDFEKVYAEQKGLTKKYLSLVECDAYTQNYELFDFGNVCCWIIGDARRRRGIFKSV
jgi:hypothetical protein